MELYTYFYEEDIKRFFFRRPETFTKYTNRNLLSYGLGATLYMPANRPNIHQEILSKKHEGLTSLVIDLEDAVGDNEVTSAEEMLIHELLMLSGELNRGFLSYMDLPLMFIRVRNLEQFKRVTEQLGEAIKLLTGVVLPKFSVENGEELLIEVQRIHTDERPFYAMPILETAKVIQKETRME